MEKLSSLTLSELEALLYANGDPRHALLEATFPSVEAAPLNSPEGAINAQVSILQSHIQSLKTEALDFDPSKGATSLVVKASSLGRAAEELVRGVSASTAKSREAELESRLEKAEKLAALLAREFGEVLLAFPEVLDDVLPEPPDVLVDVDRILPPSMVQASLLLKHPHVKQVVDHLREKLISLATSKSAAPAVV